MIIVILMEEIVFKKLWKIYNNMCVNVTQTNLSVNSAKMKVKIIYSLIMNTVYSYFQTNGNSTDIN